MATKTVQIEENGNWGWKLFVRDGEVTASKAIKYDGVLTYTTEDKYVPRGRNSQANLNPTEVIDRYESHTDASWGTLYAAVDEALQQFGCSIDCSETRTVEEDK
jgi:hypothetical protein